MQYLSNRFSTFFLTAMLTAALSLLAGCTEEEEDPRNAGKPGNIGCDEHCLSSYWEGLLECELVWNHCMDACDSDESCEEMCIDDWVECVPISRYFDCAEDCNACLSEYFGCLVDCDYYDDECIDACYNDYISCGEWDRSCWDGCDEQYEQCFYSCPNYICLDDCDEEYYENCLPSCLNTN